MEPRIEDIKEIMRDEAGRLSTVVLKNGIEIHYEYHGKDGQLSDTFTTSGFHFVYEDDKCVYQKHPDGYEYWLNEEGNREHAKHPDGTELYYDKDGKVTKAILPNGDVTEFELKED